MVFVNGHFFILFIIFTYHIFGFEEIYESHLLLLLSIEVHRLSQYIL